jgi:hypothetical protein
MEARIFSGFMRNTCESSAAVRTMQCLQASVLIHYKCKPDEEGEPEIRPHEPLNSLPFCKANSLSCR